MKRFSWVACLAVLWCCCAVAPAVAQPTMNLDRVVDGLTRPVFAGTAPGDPDRLFILEQRDNGVGRIKIFNLATGNLNANNFLAIPGLSSGSEQGLLGIAFHPNYQRNGLFYVNITTQAGGGDTRIREYQRQTADLADSSSARNLLTINQPFSNHNGGWLEFGPDGYLYIGSGDGGAANDPQDNGQDITNNLLGKILRIDVDGDNSSNGEYGIPDDNPFVGVTGDDEIWAYGIRNPWRCSFDSLTGDLYIGDVGQNTLEEIDVQPFNSTGGENYGWRDREGTSGGNVPGAIDPVYDYTHGGGATEGFSVTGGRVYRGPIAALQGHYFFADFVTDRIWSFKWDGSDPSTHDGTNFTDFIDWTELLTTSTGQPLNGISSFGQDSVGNLYVVELGGQIFQLTSAVIPSLIEGQKLLDGMVAAGGAADLDESDDVHEQLDPVPTRNPLKQIVDVIVQGQAGSATPADLSFRIESRMNGGPAGDVMQAIHLFNYQTNSFELLDNQAVAITDTAITVRPTGDVTRFVQQTGTRELTARVIWTVDEFTGAAFDWTIDVDEIVWPETD